jgi:hypothetical protein
MDAVLDDVPDDPGGRLRGKNILAPGDVPRRFFEGTPCFSPTATYMARRMAAVALMVKEVLTFPRSMPSNMSSISFRVSMATPTLPTSAAARGSSESSPIWVGRSRAALSPDCPFSSRNLNRRFVSVAFPYPA